MTLPDIELVSAKVHDAWMASKAAQGVTSRKAEDGEELIAPYGQLSEKAKELDRGTVRAVYAAIEAASAGASPSASTEPLSAALTEAIEKEAVALDRLYARIPPGSRVSECVSALTRIALIALAESQP